MFNTRPKFSVLPAIIAFGIGVASLWPATEATAQCARWNLANRHTLIQSNGYVVNISMQQTGTQLSGGGHYMIPGPQGGTTGLVSGSLIDGHISGSFFRFRMNWRNNSTGVYTGSVTPDGQLRGDTYDSRYTKSQATFYSEGRASCQGSFREMRRKKK